MEINITNLIRVSAAGLSKTIARSSTKNKCKAGR